MSGTAAGGGEEEGEAKAGGGAPQAAPSTGTTAPDENLIGRWRKARPQPTPSAGTEMQDARVEQLEAIGYLPGTQPAPDATGITVYEAEKAQPGLNLYTSGHGPVAILMDMDGNVVYRWEQAFADIWPDRHKRMKQPGSKSFRRAKVLPNGDLIAVFGGAGIIKLDKDSNVIWANPMLAHHEADIMPNGDVYTLSRAARMIPRLHQTKPILEDFVSVIGPDGQEKRRVSILECLENSPYKELVTNRPKRRGDIFHTNTLKLLDGRIAGTAPAFQKGRILTSLLVLDVIAVIDIDQKTTHWVHQGDFRRQHDPHILDNGNLLLFDNRGARPHSRVVELDPATWEPVWTYQGSTTRPFYTHSCGAAHRLPNGNTLIVESDNGRAFEVTRDKHIVWEYRSPHRAGDNNELVATLFDLERIQPDYFTGDWLPNFPQDEAEDSTSKQKTRTPAP
ncbi:MAG: arylsulfotransferase family protein [Candidatus Hydrogenedentota bacterium]